MLEFLILRWAWHPPLSKYLAICKIHISDLSFLLHFLAVRLLTRHSCCPCRISAALLFCLAAWQGTWSPYESCTPRTWEYLWANAWLCWRHLWVALFVWVFIPGFLAKFSSVVGEANTQRCVRQGSRVPGLRLECFKGMERGDQDMLWPGWIWELALVLANLACHFPFYLLLALGCQSRLLYTILCGLGCSALLQNPSNPFFAIRFLQWKLNRQSEHLNCREQVQSQVLGRIKSQQIRQGLSGKKGLYKKWMNLCAVSWQLLRDCWYQGSYLLAEHFHSQVIPTNKWSNRRKLKLTCSLKRWWGYMEIVLLNFCVLYGKFAVWQTPVG